MPRALLALYDEALPAVYGYFVRRCADRGTAEDLTSETFLAAMDAARGRSARISVPWLIGVAGTNWPTTIGGGTTARRRGRRRPGARWPRRRLGRRAGPHRRRERAARLPESHRTVLTLRYMDDCSVPECAELIGRTVHATEALLVRARRAFRHHYEEGGCAMTHDPLDVLRADGPSGAPDPEFAARLRARLESALSLPAGSEGVEMSGTAKAIADLSQPPQRRLARRPCPTSPWPTRAPPSPGTPTRWARSWWASRS